MRRILTQSPLRGRPGQASVVKSENLLRRARLCASFVPPRLCAFLTCTVLILHRPDFAPRLAANGSRRWQTVIR